MRAIPHLMISAAVLLAAAGRVQASIIALTSHHTESFGGAGGAHQFNAALDGVDHSVSSSGNGNSATTTTNYSEPNADTAVLHGTMSHTHSGSDWTVVYSQTKTRFIADQGSLTYTIDGLYESNGLLSAPHLTTSTELRDVTLGQFLFDSGQISRYTQNVVHFVDGGGDHNDIVQGSLTGSLIQGHEYEWYYEVVIKRTDEYADGGAVGSGFYTLTIADAAAVPEPASLTLFGVGALALGFAVRRRSVS